MCGIVGIYGHPEAANLAYLALYALQHRGQESAGIVVSDSQTLKTHRQMGHVSEIFTREVLAALTGQNAIGHVRYSTTGESLFKNCQPFVVDYSRGSMAVAHNGNLVNADLLRGELEAHGSIFQSTMDTEILIHLIAADSRSPLPERIISSLAKVKGAYSLLFLTKTRMIAVRDPQGFRPLVLGRKDQAYVVASETCALDLIEADFIREIEPGEMVIFDQEGVHSRQVFPVTRRAHCIFEHVYFARPDSKIFGRSVYEVRKGLGHQLAQRHPVAADMVVPVPDSGLPAAIGYSEETGIPYEMGLVRNHYVGRTFIEPEQNIRHFGVKIKLNAIRGLMEGKKVILVDDSIVRGTTSRKIIKMVRDAGAAEVHVRISSPPTAWPCFYGIDTPSRAELIGANHSVEEICRYITADSLGYLANEDLFWFEKQDKHEWYCNACFSGKYPVGLEDIKRKLRD